MRALLTTALLAALVLGGHAMYDGKTDVIKLTNANFRDAVKSSPRLFMVEFYAPWCGHCQRLEPEYEKAAGNLKGLVNLGAIDCDNEANRPICSQYGIQGFPTIKFFEPGKFSSPSEYQGGRTAKEIVSAATARMPSKVVKVTAKSFDEFGKGGVNRARFLLFTTKTATTPMFKAFSVDYADVAVFGEAKSTDKELTERFAVTSFPTLLAFPVGQEEPVTYTGSLNQEELRAFIKKHSPASTSSGKGSSAPPPPEPESEEEPIPEPVWNPAVPFVSTQAEFKEACLDKRIGVCLIAFLDNIPEKEEENAGYVKTLEALKLKAHQTGSAFHFLWVDARKQDALRRAFDLSDQYPVALLLSPNKGRFRPFLGGFDERGLDEFLGETASGRGRTFKNPVDPVIV